MTGPKKNILVDLRGYDEFPSYSPGAWQRITTQLNVGPEALRNQHAMNSGRAAVQELVGSLPCTDPSVIRNVIGALATSFSEPERQFFESGAEDALTVMNAGHTV
jgi:hypothetical protein